MISDSSLTLILEILLSLVAVNENKESILASLESSTNVNLVDDVCLNPIEFLLRATN